MIINVKRALSKVSNNVLLTFFTFLIIPFFYSVSLFDILPLFLPVLLLPAFLPLANCYEILQKNVEAILLELLLQKVTRDIFLTHSVKLYIAEIHYN